MKKATLLIVIFYCFIKTNICFAGSIAGGELTYQSLGNGQYLVYLNLLRDCSGSMAPLNVTLNVKSASCSFLQGFLMPGVPGTGQPLINGCPGASTCVGGTEFGVQYWEYSTVVNLPSQCADWIFSVLDSSRADLTTLATNQDFYIEARLNNLGQDNNSPTFSKHALFIGCTNQTQFFNHGTIDVDGDSLVYYLVDARKNNTTSVNYLTSFSGLNPLTSTPPVIVDNFNGDILVYSPIPQYAVIAVHIDEYRNGTFIGYTEKNIAAFMDSCPPSTPPALLTAPPQPLYIEATELFCFNFISNDADPGDTVLITANISSMPGATFTINGLPFTTGTFCWTPADSDTSSIPYMLTLTLTDKNCPVNHVVTFHFSIYVNPFTGIDNPGLENSIYISEPNSNGMYVIHSTSPIENLKVYNLSGSIVFEKKNVSEFDLNDHSPGIYFAEITINNKPFIRKIVKSD